MGQMTPGAEVWNLSLTSSSCHDCEQLKEDTFTSCQLDSVDLCIHVAATYSRLLSLSLSYLFLRKIQCNGEIIFFAKQLLQAEESVKHRDEGLFTAMKGGL